VRWTHLLVSVDQCGAVVDVVDVIGQAIEDAVEHDSQGRLLACRIELTGQTGLHGELLASMEHILAESRAAALGLGEEAAWIERLVLNDCHTVERQRVTLMEEYWHILLGHKLTKIARVADGYGRTYDQSEEHDAFYLASATLLPRSAMIDSVSDRTTSANIARKFGTSAELVDYRLKRLGLWREHVGKRVALSSD
jgi:hypothetical protein